MNLKAQNTNFSSSKRPCLLEIDTEGTMDEMLQRLGFAQESQGERRVVEKNSKTAHRLVTVKARGEHGAPCTAAGTSVCARTQPALL